MKLKRASVLIKIVILALVIYAGVSLWGLRQQTDNAKEKLDELQQQVDDAMQVNSELQYDIDNRTDPDILEDVARKDIGLVRPGEKIFYDVGD